MLVERNLVDVSTGSANDPAYRTPLWQWVWAMIGWMTIPFLITWFFVIRTPSWTSVSVLPILMLATFVMTIIGVPLVRWGWGDHGGRRKDGPWRPS
jgi:membrane protein YdbS with pleckstrin-like domain